MKYDVRVARMMAAVLTSFFGAVWIALYISGEVAPPEPQIATLGRHVCLALFVVCFGWAMVLYAAFRRETSGRGTGPEGTSKKG